MPVTERLQAALADRYQIQREIGSGGMATVYLARDIKHDRDVALKVLRSDLSAVIGTERFLSEVRISAKFLSDGRIFIGSNEGPNTWSYSVMTVDGNLTPLAKPSRLHASWDIAADMSRAMVTTSRYQGDAWLMKVSRK